MKTLASLTTGLFLLSGATASAERLITSLSSHQVLVSSSFTGTELVLFGAIESDAGTTPRKTGYNIIVTVAGAPQQLVVRRKDRIAGIWTNAESNTFLGAPTYLSVLSNKPLDEIAPAETLRRLDIGPNLIPRMHVAAGIESGEETFRDALIRLRKQRHLYIDDPAGVTFITPNLFRASIRLPAESPVGIYDVDVRLFADSQNIARASSAIEVVKVGIEQFIVTAARDHGILYGLFTTLMALLTGWFASIVFRRD